MTKVKKTNRKAVTDIMTSCETSFIKGQRISLREVRLSDVNQNYYRWLNDPEVTRFLETRYIPQSLENIRRYVEAMDGKSDEIFLAICLNKNSMHVGNIKIGPINWVHRFADLALIIGEKACWGKGYGTEAVNLAVDYSFNTLNLNRLTAGIYACNIGSIKAFKKANFKEEGLRKNHRFYNGNYVDEILLGIERS